jgi:uncharacterized HAD superfamily protein
MKLDKEQYESVTGGRQMIFMNEPVKRIITDERLEKYFNKREYNMQNDIDYLKQVMELKSENERLTAINNRRLDLIRQYEQKISKGDDYDLIWRLQWVEAIKVLKACEQEAKK